MLDTEILIDNDSHVQVVIGSDFLEFFHNIKERACSMKNVSFDIQHIKEFKQEQLDEFRKAFYRLIKFLRDNRVCINFDEIRKQSLLMGIRVLGPKKLGIDYYDKCNLQCLYCYNFHGPIEKKEKKGMGRLLDTQTIKKVFDQAYEIGVETICCSSGGELLLAPEASSLFEMIAQKGFALNLFTNATALKQEHLLIFKKIHGTINVHIHLSTLKKTKYQKLQRGGADNYDKVLKSISALVKLKELKKKRGEILRVGVMFVILKTNYREMADCVEYLKKMGLDYINFKKAECLTPMMEKVLIENVDVAEVRTEVLRAKKNADRLSIATTLDAVLESIDSGVLFNQSDTQGEVQLPVERRYAAWFFGHINIYGDYRICDYGNVSNGNVFKSTLKELIFSKAMEDLSGDLPPAKACHAKICNSYNECYKHGRMKWPTGP